MTRKAQMQRLAADLKKRISEIQSQPSGRAFNRLGRLERQVDKTGSILPLVLKSAPRMVVPDATRAAALARQELAAIEGITESPASRSGAEVFKAALAGEPDAQALVRMAVEAVPGAADQDLRAKALYEATVTKRRVAVAKASQPQVLPGGYGPGPIPAARLEAASAALSEGLRELFRTGLNLRAGDVMPGGRVAPSTAEWLRGPGRISIDPATRLPIPPAQRSLPPGPRTGRPGDPDGVSAGSS